MLSQSAGYWESSETAPGEKIGTALICIAVFGAALRAQDSGTPHAIAGSVLYLVGTIVVTMLVNVPRNNALANVSPSTTEAAAVWSHYLSTWTFWNHARTIAALAACNLLIVALAIRE